MKKGGLCLAGGVIAQIQGETQLKMEKWEGKQTNESSKNGF